MARNYKTPGVYLEEIPKFPPSVAAVETAIPAFIGFTEMAEKDGRQLVAFDTNGDLESIEGTRITSLLEYETYFGGPQPEENILVTINEDRDRDDNRIGITTTADFDGERSKHILYYSLQGYFANGGGPCYIFSVGPYLTPFGSQFGEAAFIKALESVAKYDEPTLIVYPEASMGIQLSNDPNAQTHMANLGAVYDAALLQCEELKDRFVIMDVPSTTNDINTESGIFRSSGVGNNNLKYGAAYYPNLRMVFDYVFDETAVDVSHTITTAGQPNPTNTVLKMNAVASELHSRSKLAINNISMELPPSALMAGIYANVDETRGVWKAPANVSVIGAVEPKVKISDRAQQDLNVNVTAGKSINAIRNFVGKGTLVWGARTLAGNDNEWRYVSVRRFFNMVEESTKKATEQFVFEPNDANTWIRVKSMIENFLLLQWRAGALQGAVPEHAFYVSVGLGETMTALDILEGRLIVEIGMAVVRPAEFIILRFSHKLPES